MAVSSIGPSGLDPFSPTPDRAPEEAREPVQEAQASEQSALPEGSGTQIDTSA